MERGGALYSTLLVDMERGGGPLQYSAGRYGEWGALYSTLLVDMERGGALYSTLLVDMESGGPSTVLCW